ncbi:hypothetical protein CYLTODRAFT_417782 [Cylindrobasidium torrendii FP15055 ss-10]|uniref:Uncharacterized protein n=1 Tax=Cylindrobasidium torrendii FP15055 ss-10 TaxID=1314674 RepID=A0A0D7BQQ7_9AGAR|nr:hypothetical protein CYLTODRAFT_417782 [Cylindrobasidium torrendii FP15055 ss-10]
MSVDVDAAAEHRDTIIKYSKWRPAYFYLTPPIYPFDAITEAACKFLENYEDDLTFMSTKDYMLLHPAIRRRPNDHHYNEWGACAADEDHLLVQTGQWLINEGEVLIVMYELGTAGDMDGYMARLSQYAGFPSGFVENWYWYLNDRKLIK